MLFTLEFYKSRRRHLFLVEGCFLFAILFYFGFDMARMDPINGWMDVIYTVPILDALFLPLTLALVASRLCEAEHKGQTFKWLSTTAKPGAIYDAKWLCGGVHVLLVVVLQTLFLLVMGLLLGFPRPVPLGPLFGYSASVLTVSLTIYSLQYGLSMVFANQMIPLAVGVVGSFIGLFSLYFPQAIQKLLPWGYYGVLAVVGMDWNPATRVIRYYWASYDYLGLALLGLWFIAIFGGFRAIFVRQEV
ncbi:ABC-2 family transporter protein [Eubacterium aggregans]|uniref:ABC-2 family transporter protein n=1 Tax=Eubacterium aggregans TaxID=81409 RepID=A0A1H3ZCL2_9FIRM|nr:ABC transporter permease [Eubacterium aggregans]SEA21513.1 ABC-2 family transporter protein [Eubacterium aggregans]